ncbi:LOW QUALITY PROTEIN: extracellular matrix protein 1 [Lagopus muta]|uniref:LOW QUALITY PROTEIN: extracellular matrix protein 1 n=1 Tax=Lagopus muta TaxID=64668 RepID=UPI00209F04A0|nr:LOW QUALITY PROTEIN: extracellular matrix protein 1 [Lagopus muta]
MAAFGLLLLLLLGTAVADLKPQNEQLIQQSHEIQQLQQEEQDFHLSPNIIASAGADDIPYPRAPSHASTWGSVLDGFPPAWPLPDDLSRYCSGPSLIPRAPRPSLPPAAFAHLRRQVAALDSFWPRLDSCCQHHAPLPCARRAWTDVLDTFCEDEFGVKTRQFHCCHQHGAARRRCFAKATVGTTEIAEITEITLLEPVVVPSFPPGEPTPANMENICRLRGLRPSPKGLPGPRARFHSRLERDFGRCCHNSSLECAHTAWQKGLERFCREEGAVKTRQHRCCKRGLGQARSRCFATAAPHPAYDQEVHNISLARPGPAMLRTLCGPIRLLSKRRPVPELLEAVTTTCCALPQDERSPCAEEQLSQQIDVLCAASRSSWRDPRGCCAWLGRERLRCFEEEYLEGVTLGAAIPPPPLRPGALISR